jgi:catechol 2,3-dioxygenase-like lactoylglutathione lyase family enzyme
LDPLISDLIDRYERGRLSRRELVAGLSALTAASAAGTAALAQPAPPVLRPVGIDHVSILASDLKRSTEFYGRVFGLVSVSEDAKNRIVRLGPPRAAGAAPASPVGAVLVSLRQEPPAGKVDHWCFKIEGFNAAAAAETLKAHGLTPDRNVEFGFHVKDPDGVVVQMV